MIHNYEKELKVSIIGQSDHTIETKDGVLLSPSSDNDKINSANGKVLVTKEWVNTNRIEQFNLSSETFKTIDHTLFNIFPNVIIIDSGGNVLEATIKYINNNRITVEFSFPFTGKVILS